MYVPPTPPMIASALMRPPSGNPGDQPEGQVGQGRRQQDGEQYDRPELDSRDDLHYLLEQTVAAYADDCETQNAVQRGPGPPGSKFGNMASTPKAAVEVTAAPNTKVTTNR